MYSSIVGLTSLEISDILLIFTNLKFGSFIVKTLFGLYWEKGEGWGLKFDENFGQTEEFSMIKLPTGLWTDSTMLIAHL